MSDIINNLLLNETATTATVGKTTEQGVKEGPSLFDSLLSSVLPKESSTEVATTVPTKNTETSNVKIEDLKVEVSTEVKESTPTQTVDTTQVKEEVVVEENKEEIQKQNNTTTSSLLDKLVLEAKKDLDKTNSKENLVNKIAQTVVIPEVINAEVENKVEVSTEVKEATPIQTVDTTQVKEEVVVEENKEEIEKQNNTTASSLLDKLVLEAKKDLDKTNSKENLVNKIAQTVVIPEVINAEVENKVEVSTEVKEATPIQTVDTTQVKEEVVVEENKEEIEKQNNTTASSLLDKLVLEAKKDLDKTNSKENLVNKIAQTVVIPEVINAEVENKVEVSTEVKVDNVGKTISNLENESLVNTSETVSVVENEELSLMDKLIQKTTEKIVTTDTNEIVVETSSKKVLTEDILTNIYLGSQKNQLSNQSLFNKKEAVILLKEGSSVEAIKVSAEMLELGLENVDIEQTKDNKLEVKKTTIDIVDRKNLIENLLAQKNVKSDEIKNLITQSVEASKALLENELHLSEDSIVNINSPLSYNIQSKIIGAKQQMATMMSDIARQMYENYKPPVTAFRINLNPTELGSIAILMKNDKNSGLSISMSVSNSVTLDTLMENQNVLKNSLNKTFNENTKFDLDFTSSNGNSNNQSSNNQDNQQNNRRFEQQIDTQSILQLQEENKDREEKILDYM